MGLSQPAMSHALNRLLKDGLFIRTPQGMVPTPRAEMLAQPLRNALAQMQHALEPAVFDPAASDRRFALSCSPRRAWLRSLLQHQRSISTCVQAGLWTFSIILRDLDLVRGGTEHAGERFTAEPLLEDPFVIGHAARPTGQPQQAQPQQAQPQQVECGKVRSAILPGDILEPGGYQLRR